MNKLDHIVETLKCWKSTFMSGTDWTFERSLGMCEIRDYLDGISQNGHDCYASFLFKNLSESDKHYILNQIDFDVNFKEMYATYDLEETVA